MRISSVSCSISKPCSKLFRQESECAGIKPAVDRDVLAGQVAGMDRAEEGADLAEFLGRAEALGGNLGGEFGLERGLVAALRKAAAQPVGVELAGQQIVDRHIVLGHRAGNA